MLTCDTNAERAASVIGFYQYDRPSMLQYGLTKCLRRILMEVISYFRVREVQNVAEFAGKLSHEWSDVGRGACDSQSHSTIYEK